MDKAAIATAIQQSGLQQLSPVLDTLILAASAPCWNVRAVRGRRVLDAGTRRASFRAESSWTSCLPAALMAFFRAAT